MSILQYLARISALLCVIAAGCDDHTTNARKERAVTLLGGVRDNFAPGNREAAQLTANLLRAISRHDAIDTFGRPVVGYFDARENNRVFGHVFQLPLQHEKIAFIDQAILTIRIKARGFDADNDVLSLIDISGETAEQAASGVSDGYLWRMKCRSLNNGRWYPGDERTLILDLAHLPVSGFYPSDVTSALLDGAIGLVLEDDTQIDYARLDVRYRSSAVAPQRPPPASRTSYQPHCAENFSLGSVFLHRRGRISGRHISDN